MNRRIAVLLACSLVAGCAGVKPWQREHLAEPGMAWQADPVLSAYGEHVYFSKEASSGGSGIGSAGCGCN